MKSKAGALSWSLGRKERLKDAFLRVNQDVQKLKTMHDKDAARMQRFEDVPDDAPEGRRNHAHGDGDHGPRTDEQGKATFTTAVPVGADPGQGSATVLLSSEEFGPRELVRQARKAEEIGLDFVSISDHFHPWVDAEGHSPFVWGVIGAIAARTERLRLGTGVTCPTIRIHPAIVAQAAATAAAMLPGRFFLGVGTGENLNEHILGDTWPITDQRLDMLEEAVEVMRELWSGEEMGVSAFLRREDRIFHTYSCFERGIDPTLGGAPARDAVCARPP